MACRFDFSTGVGLTALALAAGGCAHPSMPIEGKSTFSVVDPIGTRVPAMNISFGRETKPFDGFVPAHAIEPLASPQYPVAALGGVGGEVALVGVMLRIGADGAVAGVEPSLVCFSTPGPWASAFRAAVDAAVQRWRFVPARRQHLEPVPMEKGGVYWRAATDEPIETTMDIVFTFTSDGAVSSGARPR